MMPIESGSCYAGLLKKTSRCHCANCIVGSYRYHTLRDKLYFSLPYFFHTIRIVVRIDSWDVDSMYPNGHFVRSLGAIGELETEIAAVLVEKNLSVGPFSEGLVSQLFEFKRAQVGSDLMLKTD